MSDFQKPDRIERAIAKDGIYASKTDGVSMEPMLKKGRDTVIIKKAELPLKKYDIPVYHREDRYVMHRVVKVTKNGYIICGDNCLYPERDITDKDVAGMLAAFYHDGKYVEYGDREYMRYARRAVCRYHLKKLKRLALRIKGKLKAIIKK